MTDFQESRNNHFERIIYNGFEDYIEKAEKKIIYEKIEKEEQMEIKFELYRKAFFLSVVEKMHVENREANISKVTSQNTRICLKNALYQYSQLRTIRAENMSKEEKEKNFFEIMQLLNIQKEVEEYLNEKINVNLFNVINYFNFLFSFNKHLNKYISYVLLIIFMCKLIFYF